MAWFDRNRRQPAAPPDPVEPIDLHRIHTDRQQAKAAADAAAWAKLPEPVLRHLATVGTAQPPSPDVLLERYLVPPHARKVLPPVELAQAHDVELAELLIEAGAVYGHARAAAAEWREAGPLGDVDLSTLSTEQEIVDALAHGRYRLFARALIARSRASESDDEARSYALLSVDLHRRLDDTAAALAAQVADLYRRAAAEKRERHVEDGDEVAGKWRQVVSLRQWTRDPARPFQLQADSVIPVEAVEPWREAMRALGHEDRIDGREGSYVIGEEVPPAPPPEPALPPRRPGIIRTALGIGVGGE